MQDDPARLKNYFLKGYSMVLALTVPITVACALFADDITLVLLGPKWTAAAPIFRLLAPTIVVFAIANPLFWLLSSLGLVGRSLKMSFVIAPVMIVSYLIAIPYGPRGVAFAYSAAMVLWVIPLIVWAVHGTAISVRDILLTVGRPIGSAVVAAGLAFGFRFFCGSLFPPLGRLVLETFVLSITFLAVVLFAAGQKDLYLDVFRGLMGSSSNASVNTLQKSEAS